MRPEPALSACDPVDLGLIEHLHGGLPLVRRPFDGVGETLGLAPSDVLARLQRLLADGVLSRFGPLFQIERAGGMFVLAALEVPQDRYEEVTATVNAMAEVAHNYRREHRLNMWFVVATESEDLARQALDRIGQATGLPVYAFPKEREFFVELRLPLGGALAGPKAARPAAGTAQRLEAAAQAATPRPGAHLGAADRRLVAALQAGLPLVPEPYEEVGRALGLEGSTVCARLQAWLEQGLVRRIGAVPNHYRLGFVANGMTVWDVDDDQVDALGQVVGRLPGVSHCYRRPRALPVWRYNLFAMLHGRSREEVEVQRDSLRAVLGPACRADEVLYSSAILKKTGLRLKES